MGKNNDKEKSGFFSAVLGVFLVGTVAVFLILMLVLLERNGTLARAKRQLAAWKVQWEQKLAERKKKEEPFLTNGEERTYFGPEGGKAYDFWELFAWVQEEEKPDEEEVIPGLHRELAKNPVNGTEGWWKDTTKLSGEVFVYAQEDTPLYGAPDKATEIFGYTRQAERFRLFAVFEDGWYVVTDGDYYYCSEGNRYTLTVPDVPDFTEFAEEAPVYYKVAGILQEPELPHGCEVTSLAMLLGYFGIAVDKCELADKWLPKGDWGRTDFRKAFVGNPRNIRGSAGCYAQAVAATAEAFLADGQKELSVKYGEGFSTEELVSLLKVSPVLVWTTMKLRPSYIAQVWTVDGEELLWQNCEHCIVLTGYDFQKGVFYGMDPLYGACEYDMRLFYLRFVTMFSQVMWLEE